jgi:lipoprotein-releasing system ATP-binding protein
MNSVLEAIEVKKHFSDAHRVLEVLKGVNLCVQKGESIAIAGVSGAGKSTLLHLLGALDRPTAGTIILAGHNYNDLKDKELAQIRNRRVGFIFQFHHLLAEFSALENVMIPSLINGSPREEVTKRAKLLLEEVGLGERLNHRPAKLSGGEQQRVALTRALVNDPDIVLADEPTGDLDLNTGAEMINLIWAHTVERGKSLVIVTHDPEIASKAHRIYRLHNGILCDERA